METLKKTIYPVRLVISLFLLATPGATLAYGQEEKIDLSGAFIVVSASEAKHIKAAEMLRQEIDKRTGITLATTTTMPSDSVAAIVLGREESFPCSYSLPPGLSVPSKAEGYALWVGTTARTAPTVYLVGRDDKGVLFAAGRLIRLLYLSSGYIRLTTDVQIATAPAYPIRGQQILRTTQSNDGFVDWYNIPEKEQYIRNLVLFGCNGIVPKAPGDIDVFLDQLGLDLFVTVGGNKVLELDGLTDAEIRDEYSDLVGVDHFDTHGGDTSSARLPMDVFPALERVVPLVLESQPGAKWWYSNQCMDDHAVDYDDYIFDYIQTNEPMWLYGMIYGPWTKRGIPEIRADLPSQYKIRHFPDICHVRWCQYVVPKWDRAWAQVWDRNISIYAMPQMMAQIHNATCEDTVGFVPYNHTGSYNDLNKFVFTAMGWDPNTDVNDILHDYAKVFFAYDYAECPDGDFTDDCRVDMKDFAVLARDWLTSEPDSSFLRLWYKSDETGGDTAYDSSGNFNDGAVVGDQNWDPGGYHNGCLFFDDHTRVEVPTDVLSNIDKQVTFAVWVKGNAASSADWPNNWVFDIGSSPYVYARVPDDNNNVVWNTAGDELVWYDSNSSDWYGQWVHYGFVKNSDTGIMRIYRNGEMVAEKTDAFTSMLSIRNTPFYIGAKRTHAYDYKGGLDDFKVFDYALNTEQISNLAMGSCHYPQLWYKFDASSGDVVSDSSGNGNTAARYNMDDVDWVAGQFGNALEFDGVDDYVYNGNLSTTITADMSISCWINMVVPNEAKRALDLGGLQVRFDAEGRVGWDNDGGPDHETFSTDDIDDGLWHHVVFVRSGTNYQMYIDGDPDSTDTGTVEDYGWIYVGRRSSGSYFAGRVDEICIYDYALSGEEITYLGGGIEGPVPWNSPADADGNKKVDANDLAILADTWLDEPPNSPAVWIEAGTEAVAQGLLLLGENWTGPLADNTSAEAALKLWKDIAGNMGAVAGNWRLELFLCKAFLDAQVKRKYDAEMQYQQEAYEALEEADVVGVSTAVSNARAALAKIDTEFQSKAAFKQELQSWGLTGRYGELDETLDSMYQSLTDRQWLEDRFDAVSGLADIEAILNYEDAGPGGFYDNLGVVGMQPHLVRQKTWEEDPGFVHSPIEWNDHKPGSSRRQSQLCHATSRYDTPLLMRWEGLDPGATYHIEVVYLGPFDPEFECETDDGYLIHGPRGNTEETPASYSIPPASTNDGVLQLEWQLTNVVRGVSVTEIWLIKD